MRIHIKYILPEHSMSLKYSLITVTCVQNVHFSEEFTLRGYFVFIKDQYILIYLERTKKRKGNKHKSNWALPNHEFTKICSAIDHSAEGSLKPYLRGKCVLWLAETVPLYHCCTTSFPLALKNITSTLHHHLSLHFVVTLLNSQER